MEMGAGRWDKEGNWEVVHWVGKRSAFSGSSNCQRYAEGEVYELGSWAGERDAEKRTNGVGGERGRDGGRCVGVGIGAVSDTQVQLVAVATDPPREAVSSAFEHVSTKNNA